MPMDDMKMGNGWLASFLVLGTNCQILYMISQTGTCCPVCSRPCCSRRCPAEEHNIYLRLQAEQTNEGQHF